MILVAGLGCRRGCGADELLALLRACLREAGLDEAALNALASSEAKALEGGLRDLSRQLRLPLELLDAQRLAPYEQRLTSTSERARQVTGSAGVAEAAALALAERHRGMIGQYYDCSYAMHRGLADMYLADERFTKNYEDLAQGLAQWIHDAIHANADRHPQEQGTGWSGQ